MNVDRDRSHPTMGTGAFVVFNGMQKKVAEEEQKNKTNCLANLSSKLKVFTDHFKNGTYATENDMQALLTAINGVRDENLGGATQLTPASISGAGAAPAASGGATVAFRPSAFSKPAAKPQSQPVTTKPHANGTAPLPPPSSDAPFDYSAVSFNGFVEGSTAHTLAALLEKAEVPPHFPDHHLASKATVSAAAAAAGGGVSAFSPDKSQSKPAAPGGSVSSNPQPSLANGVVFPAVASIADLTPKPSGFTKTKPKAKPKKAGASRSKQHKLMEGVKTNSRAAPTPESDFKASKDSAAVQMGAAKPPMPNPVTGGGAAVAFQSVPVSLHSSGAHASNQTSKEVNLRSEMNPVDVFIKQLDKIEFTLFERRVEAKNGNVHLAEIGEWIRTDQHFEAVANDLLGKMASNLSEENRKKVDLLFNRVAHIRKRIGQALDVMMDYYEKCHKDELETAKAKLEAAKAKSSIA
jgi:hypothetical protein